MLDREFIVEQLLLLPPDRALELKDHRAIIRCPFHKNGEERTPSFNIYIDHPNREPGSIWCFGCDYGKNHRWEDFAKDLGLSTPSVESTKAWFNISGLVESQEAVSIHDHVDVQSKKEVTKDWRKISHKLLQAIGACYTFDRYNQVCLFLPVMVHGKYRGGIYAALEKIPNRLSYVETHRFKSKVLFPFDYVNRTLLKKFNQVVLVEGPRDALRLIQNGIPAYAILGATSWSSHKLALIENQNIDRVLLCFDGDEAGSKCTKQVYASLKSANIPVSAWRLDDGADPASIDKSEVMRIKESLLSHSSIRKTSLLAC